MMQLAGFFVPEEFWPDVGYEGDAVWVATWWEPGGDEACWGNGRSSATGEHRAYLTLMDYPPNRKLLHKSEPGR
ncbi:MAG: hypothetical protein GY803_22335 [Chloroflexi bacterium]|nr:hypothetical protein [Chloroflexota bacterium]